MENTEHVEFYAHVGEDGGRSQPLRDHLQNTAQLAAGFAAPFGAEGPAYLAGLLHDVGKYSRAFQRRLRGAQERVDHSTAGAIEAFKMRQGEIAFAVAGHHSGLPDGGSPTDIIGTTLHARLKRKVEPYAMWRQELTPAPPVPPDLPSDSFTRAFYTRMLYSCLVDADYLDTEAFMDGEKAALRRRTPFTMPELLNRLEAYISPWWKTEKELNRRRCEILRACMDGGRRAERGLYTLTVPTGGGKTVSSLAFALSMACERNMDRIIYVIPYTSIIDQNAAVFSKILGRENVLEHHSGVDYTADENDGAHPSRKVLATENWDVPVVVTTAVQFFESLFANRSSRCRKLHNLANSIILFDEAQTMPVPYLRPCVAAIAQLVQHYRAAAVLCTATQPALGPLFAELAPGLPIQEICPEPERQFTFFRRTTLSDLGELSRETLSGRLRATLQALCVVNRRQTAQDLYASLKGERNLADSYCLTTLLYPAHRKRLLEEIRQRLQSHLPCQVVSTSLIEAGVDVDFPVAYRELAGLDSILQTAGRCNREGDRPAAESPVYIFRLAGQPAPKLTEQNIDAVRHVLRDYDDPSGLDAIESYFTFLRTLKGDAALDKENILDSFRYGIQGNFLPFASVAEKVHLIDTGTRPVYIPLEEGKDLISDLRQGKRSRSLFRKLGQYAVNVYPLHLERLERAGAVQWLDEEVIVLTDPRCYDAHTGLQLDPGEGRFFMI